MKKMKKIFKGRVFLVIITVIITIILTLGTTVFAAILYQANQVGYTPSDKSWNVTAVDQALNDLYSTMKTKLNSTTATDSQILSGATAYSKGSLVTGTMANRGAVSTTIDPGASYTIPAGYHNGSGTVTASNPSSSISVVGSVNLENSNWNMTSAGDYSGSMTATVNVEVGKTYAVALSGHSQSTTIGISGGTILATANGYATKEFWSVRLNGTLYIIKATSNQLTVNYNSYGAGVIINAIKIYD